MKKFTKLALATSVAFSANAMAMQALDDASLSATTGQDGLSIGIGISRITIDKMFIHDNDGLKGGYTFNDPANNNTPVTVANGTAGAIVIQGSSKPTSITLTSLDNASGATYSNADHGVFVGANYSDGGVHLLQSRNLADIQIDTDAGDARHGGAFLNIAAAVSGLEIHLGEIGIGASNAMPATGATSIRRGIDANNYNPILSGLSILTGKMDAKIQLGSAPQGAMIKLNTTMVGGLEIKNLGILDNSTKDVKLGSTVVNGNNVDVKTADAGEIYIESIKITDASSRNLVLNQDIQVFNNAYVNGDATSPIARAAHIRIVSHGGAKDQYIKGIHLGSRDAASRIGDMEVQGLQTYYSPSYGTYNQGAVITISGK